MKTILVPLAMSMSVTATETVDAQNMKQKNSAKEVSVIKKRGSNPYTLVYEGAIIKNEKGKVNIHRGCKINCVKVRK